MIFFLVIWSVVGLILAAIIVDSADGVSNHGPLALGFLSLVLGPIIFAFYLILAIFTILSKLDDKWFK